MRGAWALVTSAVLMAAAPDLKNARWPAYWIASGDVPARAYSVQHFRKTIKLNAKPEHFRVLVSGDNRYSFFVNGEFVATGPVQSDLRNWHYDSLDIAGRLRPGDNTLAAMVWNGGEFKPMAQISDRTGFVLQGVGAEEQIANTNASWRVYVNPAYSPISWAQVDKRLGYQYYVAGGTERFDSTRYPWGWSEPVFADARWKAAEQLAVAVPAGVEGHVRWQLTPTELPQLEERQRSTIKIVRGVSGFPITVAAKSEATILLDEGELTTGYPVLTAQLGRGAEIQITYSEALYDAQRRKGNRKEIAGKRVIGVHDVVVANGGKLTWQALWVRSWRFVELHVKTAAEPLAITGWTTYEVGFPAKRRAEFECDREDVNAVFRTAWRTVQLGAQDVFVSDLAWERIQYVGDTRLHALTWLAMTGDDRLFRQALMQFDASRTPEGLTQSRYPADLEQFTPLYSLVWINMLHDWWMYRGEPDFMRGFLPGVEQVLGWFQRHETKDGLIPPLFQLDFVDSDYGKQRDAIVKAEGSPAMGVHSLLYAYALDDAADLYRGLGLVTRAESIARKSAEVKRRIRELFWDEGRKLFADTPSHQFWSQQANVMAALTGVATAGEFERTMEDKAVAPLQLYFRFYLGRALKKMGRGDKYIEQLEPWFAMLRNGMTTFGESDVEPRSECHPWSATPGYELLATVAGIEPADPGFASVRIAPSLGSLKHVRAKMPHPKGDIEVEYTKTDTAFTARVKLPDGLKGTFVWNGRAVDIAGDRTLTY